LEEQKACTFEEIKINLSSLKNKVEKSLLIKPKEDDIKAFLIKANIEIKVNQVIEIVWHCCKQLI
jgi:hypothetical protein